MALKRISEFAWDGIITKTKDESVLKSINLLRNRANEVAANGAKYATAPAPIDFKTAQQKLKFTGSAVETLKTLYDKKQLPTYSATLPSVEKKRRDALLGIASASVAAAQADLVNLKHQMELFEEVRIKGDSSLGDLRDRFPHVAKEIESEIDEHSWLKDSQ